MKKRILELLPNWIIVIVYRIRFKFRLFRAYFFEYSLYSKYSYLINVRKNNLNNLLAQLLIFSHSLEKGLSHEFPKSKFGVVAALKLCNVFTKYIKSNFNLEEHTVLIAYRTLQDYVNFHLGKETLDDRVQKKYYELSKSLYVLDEKISELRSVKTISIDNQKYRAENSFDNLLINRVSIRNFGEERIDVNRINQAIEMAILSPSACNRQPWKVKHITSKPIIEKLLSIQNGFNSWGENLNDLLLITVDYSFYGPAEERNAAYIDGGIFTATLLYSLHSRGIATCVLNSSLSIKNELIVKRILNLPKSERYISFIALGSYKDIQKIPSSNRIKLDQIYTIYEEKGVKHVYR